MDGKSFLPLVVNRRKNIKDRWPDTFLIESSGRRDSYDKTLSLRTKFNALLSSHNDTGEDEEDDAKEVNLPQDLMTKNRHLFFSSHEEEDDEIDEEEDEEGRNAK